MSDEKGGTGLPRNTSAGLSVMLGPTILAPLMFLILEKDKFVRSYAMQSLIVFLTAIVISRIFALVPFLGKLNGLIWIGSFVVWLVMIYQATNGKEVDLPIVGKLAKKLLGTTA